MEVRTYNAQNLTTIYRILWLWQKSSNSLLLRK
nr:MAG TPA: hypothetical protein [Caudoviricetes sp.]